MSNASRRAPRALLLSLLAAGCGTRIVDLNVPDGSGSDGQGQGGGGPEAGMPDAPPATTCEQLMRADGTPCKLCTAADGMIFTDCKTTSPPADAQPAPTGDQCKTIPTGDTRCLLCPTASGMLAMVCLKCDAPIKTSDKGDYCRACGWSDADGRCLQCFTVDGTSTLDDCDALRAGTPADAGGSMSPGM